MDDHNTHNKEHEEQEHMFMLGISVDEWIANLRQVEQLGTGVFIPEEIKCKYPNILEAEKIYNSKLYKALK